MKSIVIEIERLGAIQDSKIEIKPFMLFSGKSGLGKSYIAMLVHYVYKVLLEDEFTELFSKKGWTFESMKEKYGESGSFQIPLIDIWEYVNRKAKDYMKSMTGNLDLEMSVKIIFPITDSSVQVNFEKSVVDIGGKTKQTLHVSINKYSTDMAYRNVIGSFLFRMMFVYWLRMNIFDDESLRQACLLIPGRGALLSIPVKDQEELHKSSGMFSEFIDDWNIIRTEFPEDDVDKDLIQMLNEINEGEISYDDSSKNLYYFMPNVKPIPLIASASSVKELAPLSMLLSKFPAKGLSILFEEPEAHLHPSKQIKIADFIVEMVTKGAHLQITTHSDYIIRRINDRIILNKIKKIDEEKYKKICESYNYSESSLDVKLVSAYILKRRKDGSVDVEPQTIGEEGIPYTTFQDVIVNELRKSMDVQRELNEIKHAAADL